MAEPVAAAARRARVGLRARAADHAEPVRAGARRRRHAEFDHRRRARPATAERGRARGAARRRVPPRRAVDRAHRLRGPGRHLRDQRHGHGARARGRARDGAGDRRRDQRQVLRAGAATAQRAPPARRSRPLREQQGVRGARDRGVSGIVWRRGDRDRSRRQRDRRWRLGDASHRARRGARVPRRHAARAAQPGLDAAVAARARPARRLPPARRAPAERRRAARRGVELRPRRRARRAGARDRDPARVRVGRQRELAGARPPRPGRTRPSSSSSTRRRRATGWTGGRGCRSTTPCCGPPSGTRPSRAATTRARSRPRSSTATASC